MVLYRHYDIIEKASANEIALPIYISCRYCAFTLLNDQYFIIGTIKFAFIIVNIFIFPVSNVEVN